MAKPTKLTISPTRDPALLRQHGAGGEDHHHDDGGRAAGQDGEQRPPGQHRVLGGEQPAHHALQLGGLGGEARVALDHGDVADHVADAAEHVLVVALDRDLAGLGAAHDDEVDGDIDHGEGRQQPGQLRAS